LFRSGLNEFEGKTSRCHVLTQRRQIMTRTIAEKRRVFRVLHEEGCFVLPNPWDVGSARYLASVGFKAIATTSSGFAWSTGRPDNGISRETSLAHLREMVRATDLPVNADFESGFGNDPAEVAQSVRMAIDTGVAGLSIEDSTGDPKAPLFPLDVAVERLTAARRAIDETGGDTLLVGRAENFFAGVPDLEDTITRLRAYAQAGADCLYAPGIKTREQIEAVVAAVSPKPVNLLIGGPSAFTLEELAKLGVRRVSVGGALARAAWGGLVASVQSLVDGRFDSLPKEPAGAWLNELFKEPLSQGANHES
jgi:2-methylisocitrate lyase-like PEP mutase family enzyme